NNYFSLNNLTSPLQFTNKPVAKVQAQPTKRLDFTDDPFRDYRYEDLSNISFDDEPSTDATKINSTPADAFSLNNSIHFETQDKFDPFGLDGRQSVPLPNSDAFVSVSGRASAPISSELFSEDQQLAWAARESLKLEEARKKRQLQEEADFELAISLSKAESEKF
ncbi:epidermal growth factor receptor substrate 15-like 1, partial [Anoplophora glabripennis]|uniref:epidermal growth factor receptor substrate 15-like 1 n=1 Tax=Anoplophora glabripennis TaxID=217634 RepID=UPI000875282C